MKTLKTLCYVKASIDELYELREYFIVSFVGYDRPYFDLLHSTTQ
jgi:hypothetical protein